MKILNSFLALLLSSSSSYGAERDKDLSLTNISLKKMLKEDESFRSNKSKRSDPASAPSEDPSSISMSSSIYVKKSKIEEDLKNKLSESREHIETIKKNNDDLLKYRREKSPELKKINEENIRLKVELDFYKEYKRTKSPEFRKILEEKNLELKRTIEENIELKIKNASLSTKLETLVKIVDPTLEKLARKLEKEEQLEKERIAQEERVKIQLLIQEEKNRIERLEQEEKNRLAAIEYEKRRKFEEEKRREEKIENEFKEKLKEEEKIQEELYKKIEGINIPYYHAYVARGDVDNRMINALAEIMEKNNIDEETISEKIHQAHKDGTINQLFTEFKVPEPVEERKIADKKIEEEFSLVLPRIKELMKKIEESELRLKKINEEHGKTYEPKKIKIIERTLEERQNKDYHIIYNIIKE